MNRLLRSGRRHLLVGVACGLGMLALTAIEARAGSLEMLVTESGGPTIPITDNGALDTDPTIGVINVNTTLLNLSLVNYSFNALASSSNSPGSILSGRLSQSGTAVLLAGGTGSVTVLATDVDYSLPVGTSRTMFSSGSTTYTFADAGSSDKFQSWFNGSNTLAAKETPSPSVTLTSSSDDPNSKGADASPTPVPLTTPYGLTNEKVITITGLLGGGVAQDQYSLTTTIRATTIPEPASMALLLTALPVTLFGAMRRRKAAE